MRMTIALIWLTLLAAGSTQAKDWRGIRPLQSTRADVERLLIHAKTSLRDTYELPTEVAVVVYSGESCGRGGSGWNVPAGTVLEIRVSPKTDLRFKDQQLDATKLERTVNPLTPVHTYYRHKEEGVIYTVFEGRGSQMGRILSVTYIPTTKDEHLRCANPAPMPTRSF